MSIPLFTGFKWSDGTTEVKTVAWKIVNPSNAPKLITPRNISLSGAVTGTATLSVREDLYEFLDDTYLCIEFFYPIKFIYATGIVIALL